MPEIIMAWEARVEFLRATNPYGQGEKKSLGPPANETPVEKRQRIKDQMRARKDY